jgi:GTP diphosphokinase / guanosine-3',5'-bis(diphosphate) 3'-diphosphatase
MNRAIFMSKVHAFAASVDAQQVELAYLLAKKIHKGQVRKELGPDGNPLRYFEHLRRTALIHIDEAGITHVPVIIADLLHDSIEDADEVQLVSAIIEKLFGEDVARLVRAVTKAPKAGYLDRLYTSLETTQGRSALIKAADRLDNLRSLPLENPTFCEKQRVETRDVFLPFFAKAEAHLALGFQPGFRRIVEQIQRCV